MTDKCCIVKERKHSCEVHHECKTEVLKTHISTTCCQAHSAIFLQHKIVVWNILQQVSLVHDI